MWSEWRGLYPYGPDCGREEVGGGSATDTKNFIIAYLGLGSNVGKRQANINKAISFLKRAGIKVTKISSFYETKPVGGPAGQRDYLNAVAEVNTRLDPKALLRRVKKIETDLGRKKHPLRWGPRVIDIDILCYGDLFLRSAELAIPHPLLAIRPFALIPLAEIAPDLKHRQLARTIKELADNISHEGIELYKKNT